MWRVIGCIVVLEHTTALCSLLPVAGVISASGTQPHVYKAAVVDQQPSFRTASARRPMRFTPVTTSANSASAIPSTAAYMLTGPRLRAQAVKPLNMRQQMLPLDQVFPGRMTEDDSALDFVSQFNR